VATGEINQSKHPIFVLISWYKHLSFPFYLYSFAEATVLKRVVKLSFILNKMHNFADAGRKVSNIQYYWECNASFSESESGKFTGRE